MLKIIRNLLLQIINDMDSGNTNISESDQKKILVSLINKINPLKQQINYV